MYLKSFSEALKYLYTFIPTQDALKFPAALGLKRTQYFLELLGNPQENQKTIHITGTSGKGSTSYLTSILLKAHGFRVGLHLSPFLLDIRETFQIDNTLISQEEFVSYLNEIVPSITKVAQSSYGKPTYFEIKTALAFYIFAKKKVDYAVIEVGMGGLYDATNVIVRPDKVGIITKIGLDHMNVLGNTLSKIAYQKAMITQKGNVVFTVNQARSAAQMIKKTVTKQKGRLILIKKVPKLKLGLRGEYQKENASLAMAAVRYLTKRDQFNLQEDQMSDALAQAHFLARFDIQKVQGRTVILDGAHNPQKMKAFISSLKKLYPGMKFNFLIAFKKGKDYEDMLKYIVGVAKTIIITRFKLETQDMVHMAEDPEVIVGLLKNMDFHHYIVVENGKEALDMVLRKESKIVITGSLYLMSTIYPLLKNH